MHPGADPRLDTAFAVIEDEFARLHEDDAGLGAAVRAAVAHERTQLDSPMRPGEILWAYGTVLINEHIEIGVENPGVSVEYVHPSGDLHATHRAVWEAMHAIVCRIDQRLDTEHDPSAPDPFRSLDLSYGDIDADEPSGTVAPSESLCLQYEMPDGRYADFSCDLSLADDYAERHL